MDGLATVFVVIVTPALGNTLQFQAVGGPPDPSVNEVGTVAQIFEGGVKAAVGVDTVMLHKLAAEEVKPLL